MSNYPEVLYQDNHIIAVNKLPGHIVQGDKTGDKPLSEWVKLYIKETAHKPGEVFLGTVHRLDRPVSGVVLFAKTSKALTRLNELFKNREIKKTYWAVVKNKPPQESGTLEHYLIKNEAKNKSKAYVNQIKNSLYCKLDYKIIAESNHYYLLEINPHTGRHHQIRVQLSAMACPIKGDLKYGAARNNENGSLHLHARKIEFIHPIKKENITIIAKPPKDILWDIFLKQLNQ
ncbi:MAG: RluA family pseudouridine synthase [Bacteroidia bacterium]|nr:RluA family pseudouridine synthase [Bacteroidia bacterium]MCZ2248109.1 RluA family pseudouridine synthase [Bacteroidia bacterium]